MIRFHATAPWAATASERSCWSRDLRVALALLNPAPPESAREQAIEKLTRLDYSRPCCNTTASSTATSAQECRWSGVMPEGSCAAPASMTTCGQAERTTGGALLA